MERLRFYWDLSIDLASESDKSVYVLVMGWLFCFNPSHAAIKILINATAAEFICKNIFPTPVQVKKI